MDFPPGTVLLDQDFGSTVINATDVSTSDVYNALTAQDRGIISAFSDWAANTKPSLSALYEGSAPSDGSMVGSHGRNGSLLYRDRYLTPTNFYAQMRTAYSAVEQDDIVSGVAETTEALAFSSIGFFAEDEDEEDVYNQIARNIDLDSRLREMWRELFTVSQFYVAVWWEHQTFKVRGTTKKGNARRKTIDCVAPLSLSLLDPLKVVPVGVSLFGQEQLAYIAAPSESSSFADIASRGSTDTDPIVARLIMGRYQVDNEIERRELTGLGIDVNHLWLLNPKNVFRHTLTRPGFQRWAPVRMRSVFELLDIKQQLRQMERAHLIGGTNFIVLITKGSDALPAVPQEIANLQNIVRTVARVPILVGDHRLSVQIITPKLDNTLRAERWNTIDARLTGRLYQMFVLGNYSAGAGGDDSVKLVRVIARGMESRRHMIRRVLEKNVFRPMFDQNDQLTSMPQLQFHPRAIALDFDAAWASFLFDLRSNNEISRETVLSQFDLDQGLEAEYRRREKDEYDDIFQTQVPFSPPNPALPGNPQPTTRDNGGGRRGGGGAAPGTGQGESPRRPTKTSNKTRPGTTRTNANLTREGDDVDEHTDA